MKKRLLKQVVLKIMDEFQKIIVSENLTILKVLRKIETSVFKLVFVINKKNILIGSVTDGDVRRGLLNKISLTEKITTLMNTQPKSLHFKSSDMQINKAFDDYNVDAIPLINDTKQIAKVIFRRDLNSKFGMKNNPVLIMAGGFGKRLGSLTKNFPKPMIKIGNQSIIERIISNCISNGFKDFYISLHFNAEKVINFLGDGSKWGVSIKYLVEKKPLGTAGAILNNKINKKFPLLVINGDILSYINYERLLQFHKRKKSDLTIYVADYQVNIPYGVILEKNFKVKQINEKPNFEYYVNAGIYLINLNTLKQFKKNVYIDMNTLATELISKKCKIFCFPINDYWVDIGNPIDLKKAKKYISNFEIK